MTREVFRQTEGGILVPAEQDVARDREHAPGRQGADATLDWFLGLPRENQEAIWVRVRGMFPWRGWMLAEGPMSHSWHALQLLDALEDAGAELGEEYT